MNNLRLLAYKLFLLAKEIDVPADLVRFLDVETRNNSALRDEVEKLLRAHCEADENHFFDDLIGVQHTDADSLSNTTLRGKNSDYKIYERIDRNYGQFGEVYFASLAGSESSQLAVKILKNAYFDDDNVRKRFEREFCLLQQFSHPLIVSSIDHGFTDSGRPFFVMEYVEGKPVTEFCDRNRLSIDQRISLFIEVCRGIQYAHDQGVIHRDLKPANILVAGDARRPIPKLLDFGVSKHIDTDQLALTATSQFIGTFFYASPEQHANSKTIDSSSDVYSLGVILFELLTGRHPFHERQPPSSAIDKSSGDVAEARTASISGLKWKLYRYDHIVRKALEQNSDKRFDSPGDFADAIEKAQTSWFGVLPVKVRRSILGASFVLFLTFISLMFYLHDDPEAWKTRAANTTTLPHSTMADCQLVAYSDTGAIVNTQELYNYVLNSSVSLLGPQNESAFIKFNANRTDEVHPQFLNDGQWVTWELPLSLYWPVMTVVDSKDGKRNSGIGPADVTIRLRFAVSENGAIQVGTIGGRSPHEHLLLLAQFSDSYNHRDFANNPTRNLPSDEYRNSYMTLDERQTFLSDIVCRVYKTFDQARIFREGPRDYYDLYQCPFSIENYFADKISVVQGMIVHSRNHDRLVGIAKSVATEANQRWSPIPSEVEGRGIPEGSYCPTDPDRFPQYEEDGYDVGDLIWLDVNFDNHSSQSSVLCIRAAADRHNSAFFHVDGFTSSKFNNIRYDGDPKEWETSWINEDAATRSLYGGSVNIAQPQAVLYDQRPRAIQLGAESHYSISHPLFRFVYFGEGLKTESRAYARGTLLTEAVSNGFRSREVELLEWSLEPAVRLK